MQNKPEMTSRIFGSLTQGNCLMGAQGAPNVIEMERFDFKEKLKYFDFQKLVYLIQNIEIFCIHGPEDSLSDSEN